MGSKNGITIYFNDDEIRSIKKACKAYGLGQSEFLGIIIRFWLFNNRLQLENLETKEP